MQRIATSAVPMLVAICLAACSPRGSEPALTEVALSGHYGLCLRLPAEFRVHDRRPATGFELASVGRGAEDARVEISAGVSLPELRQAVASQPPNPTGFAPLAATTVNGQRFVLYSGPMFNRGPPLYVLFSGAESLLSDPTFTRRDTVVACDVPPLPDSAEANWRQPLPATHVLACPSEIDDNQSLRSPRNWQARVARGKRALEWIDVFVGPISRRGSLRPREDGERFVWALVADREHWVECHYRASAVVLSRKLPAVDQCMLESPPSEVRGAGKKASCRLQAPSIAGEGMR
jgi:hypothetical protein